MNQTPYTQSHPTIDVNRSEHIRRWRAFSEDLAAIGAHAITLHDELIIEHPPHLRNEVLAIVMKHKMCGQPPVILPNPSLPDWDDAR